MSVAPIEFPPPVDSAGEFLGPPTDAEDERIEVGVAIVGGGQAGLACAIRLLQLLEDDPELTESLGEVPVAVLEKGKVAGAHQLSGAVMNPSAIRELFPDDDSWPNYGEVGGERVYFMPNKKRAIPLVPIAAAVPQPRQLRHLGRRAQPLAGREGRGGRRVHPHRDRRRRSCWSRTASVLGVRTGDKGRDKDGGEKGNFEPGSDITAKATVLAEGCWGHLTGAALKGLGLAAKDPQVWALGVKEVWEVEQPLDRVIHTLGWPLRPQAKYKEFGGSWIYPMNREGETNRVSIGFVAGLDWADARLSPHDLLQEFKLHPRVRKILEGGKRVGWGAKAIPEGGYWAMPKLHAPGMLICGDSAGMVNVPKLKGVHYAIKSGMLAAETIYRAAQGRLERLLGLRDRGLRLRDRQGPLRVAQHEAAVRARARRRRRDRQRDDDHQGQAARRPLADAPRLRAAAADDATATSAIRSPTASTRSTSSRASS